MPSFPERFILFDTEWTTWEGAKDRGWSGPGEYRELVQIGAVKVAGEELEIEEEYQQLIRPTLRPQLSDFFIELTGISQERVNTEGKLFADVIKEFGMWAEDLPLWCYGVDGRVVVENCWMYEISYPLGPKRFFNVRELLAEAGIDHNEYTSGTLPRAFGQEPQRRAHDALNDVLNMREGLLLLQRQRGQREQ